MVGPCLEQAHEFLVGVLTTSGDPQMGHKYPNRLAEHLQVVTSSEKAGRGKTDAGRGQERPPMWDRHWGREVQLRGDADGSLPRLGGEGGIDVDRRLPVTRTWLLGKRDTSGRPHVNL